MSYWTEFRDGLVQQVAIPAPSQAAVDVGSTVSTILAGAGSQLAPQEHETIPTLTSAPTVVKTGLSLTTVALLGLAAWFLFWRKK